MKLSYQSFNFPIKALEANLLLCILFLGQGCASLSHDPFGSIVALDSAHGAAQMDTRLLNRALRSEKKQMNVKTATFLDSDCAADFPVLTPSSIDRYFRTDQLHGLGGIEITQLTGSYSKYIFGQIVGELRAMEQVSGVNELGGLKAKNIVAKSLLSRVVVGDRLYAVKTGREAMKVEGSWGMEKTPELLGQLS